jgi:GNAT superfamily N-acetyltransferase
MANNGEHEVGSDGAIRRATAADADAIASLAKAFHAEDRHPLTALGVSALIAMLHDAELGRILALTANKCICGYGALCFGYSVEYGGRDAFIDDIYVAPELRGRGYGTRLFAALEAEARAAGCRALHLEIMPGNRAEQWYRRLGYGDRASLLLSKRI